MGPLTRARRLAHMRTEIVEPRALTPAERRRRADAYVSAMWGEPRWIRAWSMVMTWHLDRVERADLGALVTASMLARRRAAHQAEVDTVTDLEIDRAIDRSIARSIDRHPGRHQLREDES